MKTFLKKYWSLIILVIILIVICALSFVPGKYLLANDNYSPELNPELTTLRSLLSPAWRGYRVLGFASDSEQADIFRTGFMWLLSLVTGKNVIGQIYYFICLCVGSISMGILIKEILNISKLKKYSNLGLLVGGILYISTLWTVWTFYQSMAPYVTNFGFLPLLLLCIYRFIKDSTSKNALGLFFASLTFTAISVIATLFIVDFVFILAFVIYWSIHYGKTRNIVWKKILRTIGIFLGTQLFWILPFIYYTFSVSNDLVGSYVNRSITNSVIDLETQMQTAVNTLRFYSRILTDTNGSGLLYPIAQDYFNYEFYKVVSLIPALFSLLGIIFAIIKKNTKFIIFFVFLLGTWFLIKATNPPLGGIFVFLQDYIPLFKQVFRWPSSKLYEIFLISIDICSVVGFAYFISFLTSSFKHKKLKVLVMALLSIIVLVPTFFYMEYAFTGNLFSEKALVKVPEEYFHLEEYLKEKDSTGRIYYAPPSNENYFRTYTWGFRGSQFISYILPNPIMDLSSAVGSSYGEDAMNEIAQVFKAGDVKAFNTFMQKYDVKYILVDRSLSTQGFTYDIDWKLSQTLWNGYQSIWEEGSLELLMVPSELSNGYTEVLDESEVDTFTKDKASNSTITPYNVNANDWEIKDNSLLAHFTYSGKDSIVSNNLSTVNWQSMPTKLQLYSKGVYLNPSYPKIVSNSYSKEPFREYSGTKYDYYALNGKVFTRAQAQAGISVEGEYGNTRSIEGILEKDFTLLDLTNSLSKSTGENCANSESKQLGVNISNQGVASGLEITGNGDMPCVYQDLKLEKSKNYVVKVDINWEQEDMNNMAGFCLYSEKQAKCLNGEKFFVTGELYGEKEILIPTKISGNDHVSVILYALRITASEDANIIFRKVSVKMASTFSSLPLVSESEQIVNQEVLLSNKLEYTVAIPLIYGANSYIYDAKNNTNSSWQPSIDTGEYSLSWDNGVQNSITKGYFNFSNNLLSTTPLTDYLVFWKGENISNIPSTICLIYTDASKCLIQEMLYASGDSSQLAHFKSNASTSNTLQGIITNTSYTNPSVNSMESFVVMKSPSIWSYIKYSPLTKDIYTQYEANSTGESAYSTFYKATSSEINVPDVLLTIPQSKSNGWMALAKGQNGIQILNDSVTVDGWKQGWDISNVSFDVIYIFYWPNILGYLGYALIAGEFVALLIKVFTRKSYGKE
jgi:hypothetical protein